MSGGFVYTYTENNLGHEVEWSAEVCFVPYQAATYFDPEEGGPELGKVYRNGVEYTADVPDEVYDALMDEAWDEYRIGQDDGY